MSLLIFHFCRDTEKAFVEVNGKKCWTKSFTAVQGKQICGSTNNGWNELKVKATCTADAVKGAFTVRVSTTLNSAANDESFGIDNVLLKRVGDASDDTGAACKAPKYINKDKKCVACPKSSTCDGKTATACKSPKVVKDNKCVAAPTVCKAPKYINKDKKCVACPKGSTCDGKTATACKSPKVVKANKCVAATFKTITANFQNEKDFQGFNCVAITNCGSLGKICGGYNTKAKSHDIKKTYKNLPAGSYTVSLDFIKIDSWCVSLLCKNRIVSAPCL